jgi:hypothetical protein
MPSSAVPEKCFTISTDALSVSLAVCLRPRALAASEGELLPLRAVGISGAVLGTVRRVCVYVHVWE